MVDLTPGPDGTDEVLVGRHGALGWLRLNRPRALNSLSIAMIRALTEQLEVWRDDPEVRAVWLDGAGDRGFCAGGDVRAVREAHLDGAAGAQFFAEEYRLDGLVADYPTPVVAVMDGITMGGGVGLGMNAARRVVTERTRLAMPETTIGFFPDVGATYRLSRAPGELGTHVALTGEVVDGAGAIALGLADVLVPSAELEDAAARVAAGSPPDVAVVGEAPPSSLVAQRGWVDRCYAGDDAAEIVARLEASTEPEARAAAATIRSRSPLSVAVTLAVLRRAAGAASVHEVLDSDAQVAAAMLTDAGSDFVEGVRAQLVDKDRSPTWRHARLEDVTPADLTPYLLLATP